MAVSGTVSTTVFNTRKVIDHAFRKCRLPPEGVGGEQMTAAQETLYLVLSAFANRGLQLWCIEKLILPLYENEAAVPVGNGIVDLLNTNYRSIQYLTTATETVLVDRVTFDLGSTEIVTTVGINWLGASVAFNLQISPDGVVWETVESVSNPNQNVGEWTWVDIDGSLAARYFRVLAPGGLLDQDEVLVGNTPNEIVMARLNRDSYSNLPNKTFTGKPLQFWLDRTLNEPVMYICLSQTRLRRLGRW